MTAWECSPDFEPGYIRCTVKPLEHRGPRTPKGQPPSPRSPSIWPPWWLLLCDLNNYVCRALALKLFCGRKAVGTQPVSVCPSLAEDTVQARGALVKEWEWGWERGWPASRTACTPAAFVGLWRQRQRTCTKLTFEAKQLLRLLPKGAADKLGWRQKVEENREIHCLQRGAHGLVGRARMAVTRSDMRTGCLPSSSEDAHLKCDSGAARGKCNLDIPHWNLSLSDATRAEVGYSDQGRFM